MEAGKCPKCGKTNLDYCDKDIGINTVVYPFTCPDCGFEGAEVYSVEFSHFGDKDGKVIREQQDWPYTGGGKGE